MSTWKAFKDIHSLHQLIKWIMPACEPPVEFAYSRVKKEGTCRSRRSLAGSFLLVMFLLLAGCSPTAERPTSTDVPRIGPTLVATTLDKTYSTVQHGVSTIDSTALAPLVDFIAQNGGEIAVGTIDSVSERPLLRLCIDLPPAPPIDSSALKSNVFLGAKARTTFQSKLASYRDSLTVWKAKGAVAIGQFWTSLNRLLSRPPDERHTDVRNAVLRGNMFLSESEASWNGPTRKYFILSTDGEDNRAVQPEIEPVPGVVYILVPGTRLGCLSRLNPVKFESLPAAVRFVTSGVGTATDTVTSVQLGGHL